MKRVLGKFAIAFFIFVLGTSAATWAQAQTFTVLYSFTGLEDGGASAAAVLIIDQTGSLYGTTRIGGGSNGCPSGCGTVFKLDPSGNKTLLHAFSGGSDGLSPQPSLLMDAAGNIYGVTAAGGLPGNICPGFALGCGTVFEIDPSGNKTVLHNFAGGCCPILSGDGAIPVGLISDGSGTLYGATMAGGAGNDGTVFRLDSSGNVTILYSFGPLLNDGGVPLAAPIMDAAGNFYGTTSSGGISSNACPSGCGTVFKLDSSGNKTILHAFTGLSDGRFPAAALVMDTAGNLYGTTEFGGPFGFGIVFKIDILGNETVLHSFTFTGGDGAQPSGLALDSLGNLYGTTLFGGSLSCNGAFGGSIGCGIIFKLDSSGNETILHAFTNSGDGANPDAGLLLDGSGNLYGTTLAGGTYASGTIFKLSAPTPQQATQAIISFVNSLLSQSVLNGGQDNSLVVKLQHAIDLMNAGNVAAALGNLNAFVREVNSLVTSRVLTPDEAAPLISTAQSVIAALR